MKVTVIRSGGFAGIPRRWQVSVEKEPDEESWLALLRALPWGELPQVARQPDRYVYRINYGPDGPDPHEALIPEQNLIGAWRELVDRVRERDEQEHNPRSAHPSSAKDE